MQIILHLGSMYVNEPGTCRAYLPEHTYDTMLNSQFVITV